VNSEGIYKLCSWNSSNIDYGVFVGMLSVSSVSFMSVLFSFTTNRFVLKDFVANNFVPGENCCECLFLIKRTCSLWPE
jgi:hypothetical protein